MTVVSQHLQKEFGSKRKPWTVRSCHSCCDNSDMQCIRGMLSFIGNLQVGMKALWAAEAANRILCSVADVPAGRPYVQVRTR